MFTTYAQRSEFENAFIELYENEAAPLVEKGVSALVYTQLADVEDETNGLMTYDRRVLKVSPDRAKECMDKLYKILKCKEDEA